MSDSLTIEDIISRIHQLPFESLERLKEIVDEVSFPRGHVLLQAGKVEKRIFFVKKGAVRAYTYKNSTPVTFWFGFEGDTVISMKSYVKEERGYEDIELLENCIFYSLKTPRLKQLFVEDIYIANWGRKFVEHELIKTEERLISMQFKTAAERYRELLQQNKQVLQRVQLGYIASYLGISQVSLSRIRSKIQ